MGFWLSVKTCFRKYVTFSGRASRSEYWWFLLFIFVVGLVLGFVDGFSNGFTNAKNGTAKDLDFLRFSNLFQLVVLLPAIAVSWRRLHDTGRSGWWTLFGPIAGAVLGGIAGGIAGYLTETGAIGGSIVANGSYAGFVAGLIPGLFMLYLFTRPSQTGPNKYGPNPHEVTP